MKTIVVVDKFTDEVAQDISKKWYGKNWPVVYVLNNKTHAYIGETTSLTNRMKQHRKIEERLELTEINILANREFNKSVVLDVESKLIEYMSADNKYKIMNSNSGIKNHDYFEKNKYDLMFNDIWRELKKKKIVDQNLDVIRNSDLFKYSPYKSLTVEQYSVVYNILFDICESIKNKKPMVTVVNGEAGTGKTVVAMYLMKLIADKKVIEFLSETDESVVELFEDVREVIEDFRVGLVVPMTSLRKTLRKVMKSVDGLSAKMVIGPNDVLKEEYDLLIVDESHRLYRRIALTGFGSYDEVNRKLGLEKDATQLDWINKCSKYRIFFYDQLQSVRPSDVREENFRSLKTDEDYNYHRLESQLRVQAGADYIKYIKDIFSDTPPSARQEFKQYDFEIVDSIHNLQSIIIEKDNNIGLSRLLGGYAWKWKTKRLGYKEALKQSVFDIEIDGSQLIWNSTNSGWVLSENAINEVGSIHTIQGYDLNYAGVIIGNDLYFDKATQRIEVNEVNYFDTKGKQSIQGYEELRRYIINIYIVLLTRAIKGTYVYVCDRALKEHLSRFVGKNALKTSK